jgi:hypothetical protein
MQRPNTCKLFVYIYTGLGMRDYRPQGRPDGRHPGLPAGTT